MWHLCGVLLALTVAGHTYRGQSGDGMFDVTVVLRPNHTYTLQNRGESCWLWFEEEGVWSETAEAVHLTTEVEEIDSRTAIVGWREGGRHFRVTVRDQHGRPIEGAGVALGWETDVVLTNAEGVVTVPRKDVETLTVSHEDRSITEDVGHNDAFEVTIDLKPVRKRVTKKTVLHRNGDVLVQSDGPALTFRRER